MNNKSKLSEKREDYWDKINQLDQMKTILDNISGKRNSPAHKTLVAALDVYRDQIERDYERFKCVYNNKTTFDDMCLLQQKLNRETKLRVGLEEKVKEASESSGLFIKYVKEKLGL